MRIYIIISVLMFIPGGYVFAQYPTDWAIVSKGAFVIPSEGLPWTDPDGRAAGKRIGYMRVGTVVRVGSVDMSMGQTMNRRVPIALSKVRQALKERL